MLIVRYIAELVAHDPGVANYGVDIRVGVAINPNVYAAVGNVIPQFCSKSSV